MLLCPACLDATSPEEVQKIVQSEPIESRKRLMSDDSLIDWAFESSGRVGKGMSLKRQPRPSHHPVQTHPDFCQYQKGKED